MVWTARILAEHEEQAIRADERARLRALIESTSADISSRWKNEDDRVAGRLALNVLLAAIDQLSAAPPPPPPVDEQAIRAKVLREVASALRDQRGPTVDMAILRSIGSNPLTSGWRECEQGWAIYLDQLSAAPQAGDAKESRREVNR